MARKLCPCGGAQGVGPGGLCRKCIAAALAGQSAGGPIVQLEEIPLSKITIDGGTQARVTINEDTIAEYAALMADADEPTEFPPVVLFFDSTTYWPGDGHHRIIAKGRAGKATIKADVRKGTRLEATLFAAGANASHGLPRTVADKEKAVRMVLAVCPTYSTAALQQTAKVSWNFADKIRKEIEASQAEPPPETRTGKDGKERPAPKALPPAREVEKAEPAKTNLPPAREVGKKSTASDGDKDCLDETLPAESVASFATFDVFDDLIKQLKTIAQIVNDLAHEPGSEHYRKKLRLEEKAGVQRFHCSDITNAIIKLQDHQPYAAKCPVCNKAGKGNLQSCNWCNGLPYLTERTYLRAKESVDGAKKKAG